MTTTMAEDTGASRAEATRGDKLRGRVAFVTGGTRGIGGAISKSLVNQGAAVAMQEWTRLIARRKNIDFYRALVKLGGGLQLGKSQLSGFKLLEPGAEIDRLMRLLANIDDPDFIARHIAFTNWFEWTQAVPGTFYLWIVEHLFVNNELARGVLVVNGAQVNLRAIECPIFLLAGTTDHITPAEQVWALADLVSTPSEHIWRELIDAGHLGLFMLVEHWKPIAERVRIHSQRED